MPLTRAQMDEGGGKSGRQRHPLLRGALEARSVENFVAQMIADPDPLAREAALTSLARLEGPFPAQALVALMLQGDSVNRNAAIETLGCLGERAVDALASLLARVDAEGRIYALTALERIGGPRAAELALSVACEDADVNVCAAAIEVVAQNGVSAMTATLNRIAAKFPDQPYLAFAVRTAQKRLG